MGAALAAWFGANARALPWRTSIAGTRDPYLVLVSETMLQQTQVSRVLGKFDAFVRRFPTLKDLAGADEADVLGAWSGMGYYRRARNLHSAARMVMMEMGGVFPRDPAEIRRLPGVGRYTAGAIASIAFGLAEPIVDGNVSRVLLRVHGREVASDDKKIQPWLWERAGELARVTETPGVVNEAMMELGATVCLPPPAMPRCGVCPLRAGCAANRDGKQLEIPRPKIRGAKVTMHCGVVVVRRNERELLVEQRAREGMWGGLWQAPTIESMEGPISQELLGAAVGIDAGRLRPEASFEHQTTHRRVVFQVWRADVGAEFAARRGLWMTVGTISGLGLSNAQRRILLESVEGGTLWT